MTDLDTGGPRVPPSRARGRASRWDDPRVVPREEISSSPEPGSVPGRVAVWVGAHRERVPRFVTEPGPSLEQRLRWARRGEWAMTLKSPARRWMSVWVHFGWLPVAVVARFWEWAAQTPGRFGVTVIVAVTVTSCLNTVPVVEWVIPDSLSVLSWPPLSWIGGR